MSTVKTFASAADLEVKKVSFAKLSDHAYAYTAEGDPNTGIIIGDDAVMVIDSEATRDLIVERGQFDKDSEIGRFPRLFQNVESVPDGLTWPTMTFNRKMTLWLGKLEVQILQLGRGHTK